MWVFFLVLGKDYVIYVFYLDGEHFGFGVSSRLRQFIVCLHRQFVRITKDINETLSFVTGRMSSRKFAVKDILLATLEDILYEADRISWARFKHGFNRAAMNFRSQLYLAECRRLEEYYGQYFAATGLHAWRDPNLVVFSGDNPEGGFVSWSLVSGKIPVLRFGGTTGIMWVPFLDRPLTRIEWASSLGYPTRHDLATSLGVPLFDE